MRHYWICAARSECRRYKNSYKTIRFLQNKKTRAECHFYYQLELMQRLILSNDLFQKMFLIFTPQARKV